MNLSLIAKETLDSAEASDQESLIAMQELWLNLGHFLVAAEHIYDFTDGMDDNICGSIPDNPCIGASFALACMPNPLFYICKIMSISLNQIAYAILVAATIAYEAVDRDYEIATLGEHSSCLNMIPSYFRF